MLLSLRVENYALISHLKVDFHSGFNIITGETGSGKSILLGALGLIQGRRADTSVLSNTDKKCIVEAEYNIKDYGLKTVFEDADIDYDEITFIRREVLSSGKSRAFINDTPVNLSILQQFAELLIDIHSQHETLLLNKQSFILTIVDNFSGSKQELKQYSAIYSKYISVSSEYKEAYNRYHSLKEEYDFFSHQSKELAEAGLRENELVQLEEELSELNNVEEIKSALHESVELLDGEENAILSGLNTVNSRIEKIESFFHKAEQLSERLKSAHYELKDIYTELQTAFERVEFNPERHQFVSDRLGVLFGLLKKYGVSDCNELIEKKNQIDEKLLAVVDGEEHILKLKQAKEKIFKELQQAGDALTKVRANSFKEMEKVVSALLFDLGMPYASFKAEREGQEFSPNGADKISFMFSANKNHPMQEVSKVASGGELSRLMLSLKYLLSGSSDLPTIILDEIDTGVSGDIADKVGNIIKAMAKGMQVINITHLPQVASKGDAHYLVYKNHDEDITQTKIRLLNDEERLQEIAKMLSGEQLSDAALENAKVLLSAK